MGDIHIYHLFQMKTGSPVRNPDMMCIQTFCRNDILTSGKSCSFYLLWMVKYLLCITITDLLPVIDNKKFFAEPIDFIPAVGHQDHRPVIITQKFHHLLLQTVFQEDIQCRKRFIKKDDGRLICHNPRQCNSLLLTTGKLSRKSFFQPLQAEMPYHLLYLFLLLLFITGKSGSYILCHGHCRE